MIENFLNNFIKPQYRERLLYELKSSKTNKRDKAFTSLKNKYNVSSATLENVIKCKNPRCITSIEQEIVHTFKLVDREKKVYRCAYCDAEHKNK